MERSGSFRIGSREDYKEYLGYLKQQEVGLVAKLGKLQPVRDFRTILAEIKAVRLYQEYLEEYIDK